MPSCQKQSQHQPLGLGCCRLVQQSHLMPCATAQRAVRKGSKLWEKVASSECKPKFGMTMGYSKHDYVIWCDILGCWLLCKAYEPAKANPSPSMPILGSCLLLVHQSTKMAKNSASIYIYIHHIHPIYSAVSYQSYQIQGFLSVSNGDVPAPWWCFGSFPGSPEVGMWKNYLCMGMK